MGRIRGTKKIRKVFTGAREYYAYDLDEDVFGKVKRVYGNTEEEVREKIKQYEEEKAKGLSTRKPKSNKLWNYILFYFKGAVGKKSSKDLQRLMALCEDLIKDSVIDKNIDTITEEEMQDYYDALAEKYSIANVTEIDTILRKTFSIAEGLAENFNYENIEIPTQEPITVSYDLTPAEYDKFVTFLFTTDKFTLYTKAIIALLLVTGMKYEDVGTIKRKNVNLENGTVSNSKCEWTLPEYFIKWLRKEEENGHITFDGEGVAFSNNGKKISTYQTLQSTLSRMIVACGLPRGLTIRSLRSSFVNYKMQNGTSIEELAGIMYLAENEVSDMWEEIQFKKQLF